MKKTYFIFVLMKNVNKEIMILKNILEILDRLNIFK